LPKNEAEECANPDAVIEEVFEWKISFYKGYFGCHWQYL
jgi:hypothetical protein